MKAWKHTGQVGRRAERNVDLAGISIFAGVRQSKPDQAGQRKRCQMTKGCPFKVRLVLFFSLHPRSEILIQLALAPPRLCSLPTSLHLCCTDPSLLAALCPQVNPPSNTSTCLLEDAQGPPEEARPHCCCEDLPPTSLETTSIAKSFLSRFSSVERIDPLSLMQPATGTPLGNDETE